MREFRSRTFSPQRGVPAFSLDLVKVPSTQPTRHYEPQLRIETEHKKSLGDQGSKTPQESRSLAKAPSACEFGEGTDKILRLVIGRQLIRDVTAVTAPE